MNNKFLSYYNKELTFLKEMGREFALRYPKVASRLALNASDIPDPYIERLLEGVASRAIISSIINKGQGF